MKISMNCADLDKLIEAVDAGSIPRHDLDAFIPVLDLCSATNDALSAYNGSIDAAKALHEALLPGWIAKPQIGGAAAGVKVWHCTVEDWETGDEVESFNMPDPARAWLIAIIRAYEAQQ